MNIKLTPKKIDGAPHAEGPVYVRKLVARDFVEFRKCGQDDPNVILVTAVAYIGDEDNQRVYSYDDLDAVGELPMDFISFIIDAGNEYNSELSEGKVEEHEKN